MAGLIHATCAPCRGGAPTLTDTEVAHLQPQVADWRVVQVGGIKRIERTYAFKDFRQAMEFTARVGELAEREQHHPDIHLSWGKVRVETWTHKINGLHENDFILAAKADEIYTQSPRS
jgi:4a-hydroxytetrahydrobiopterin dehydratase